MGQKRYQRTKTKKKEANGRYNFRVIQCDHLVFKLGGKKKKKKRSSIEAGRGGGKKKRS
ncbi:hypothetical protein COCC4DRAFT_34526 [Bipolaris maydis ATCC 48331]|uniref:Uncharacterized protein n=2 Tax=Cochliobolus heterostrophus TaxID=5016 RepID=M2SJ84_COCH5|nr:uncharacterized protein COCC4DRAFT_34526 [Bipolaris maydis ATCC 48331]EMD85380.1 hypothetical protein COCHEDRAFT_1024572 [Bipolaris maydis C5]ENI00213.1 hypothetical protein COCC4DRAFT_34526 [Bipolaris maydis ATCC 48331]